MGLERNITLDNTFDRSRGHQLMQNFNIAQEITECTQNFSGSFGN